MEALDRTLIACALLAVATLVLGSPIPAIAATGALALAALAQLVSPVASSQTHRELDSSRTVAGGEVADEARVEGTLRLPGIVTVHDELPRIGEPLEPGSKTHVGLGSFDITCRPLVRLPVRGVAHFGPLTVKALDPLGISSRELEARPADSVTVWPRAEDADEQPLRARYERMLSGEHRVSQPGASMEFYGIREYQPSDPMSKVNWNQTAAKSELLVNQFEKETYGEVAVFLDARRITGVGTRRENPLNEVCNLAATVGNIAHSERDQLRAYTFGPADNERFRPEPGVPWIDQFKDWLSELGPEGDTPAQPVFDEVLPHLTERSMVVFITPMLGDEVLGDAPLTAMALDNDVLVVAPGIPDSLPEELADELEEERRQGIEAARGRGIPVVDAARSLSLEQAIEEQEAIR